MKFFKIHFLLTILFVLLLLCVQWIPDAKVDNNLNLSRSLLEAADGTSGYYLLDTVNDINYEEYDLAILDSVSGNLEGSHLLNAMTNSESGSVWNGTQVLLRPLFHFFHLIQIRYIWMLTFFSLLFFFLLQAEKKIGRTAAFLFLFTLLWGDALTTSASLLYMGGFLTMFLSCIYLLRREDAAYTDIRFLLRFFYITGAVTAFLDSALIPVLTLSAPIMLLILLTNTKLSLASVFKNSLLSVLGWLGGYLFMILTKWILVALISGKNCFPAFWKSLSQKLFPATDSLFGILSSNLKQYISFMGFGFKLLAAVFILLCIAYAVLLFMHHRAFAESVRYLPLLLPAVLPLIYLAVIPAYAQNHLDITFRTLFISACSMLILFLNTIDYQRAGGGHE